MEIYLLAVADDPKQGMTWAQLEAFVARAKTLGVPPDALVKARVTWRGRIRSLTFTGRAGR